MTELELLEQINKATTVCAVLTAISFLILIFILLTKFMNSYDIIYKGDKKK